MLTRTLAMLAAAIAAVACASTPAHAWPYGGSAPGQVPAVAPGGDLDIDFNVDVGEPLMAAGQEQTAFIKVTLGGFALPGTSNRPPINLAVVLDRSASMAGDSLEKAKEAALMIVDRLQPDDIISVVTYDSDVEILVPATRANEKDSIREQIASITPRGATALFAGVSHGIEEVSKFLDPKRVNRIILLSDGQANVGPRSPNELGRLGEVAGRQGISITTIGLGLGYNEDLMTQLAMASDGNHGFAENADDLATIFNHELGDIMSVVARDVVIDISFDDGIIPVRAIGRDSTITGRTAKITMNQLYAKQEKFVLFEVKVPPGAAGKKRSLANVTAKYANMISNKPGTRRGTANVEFSVARTAIAQRQNKRVMETAIAARATDENRRALALRDQGKVDEAERVLRTNAKYLADEAARLKSRQLQVYSQKNADAATAMKKPAEWNETRKTMRTEQYKNDTNQAW